MDCTYSIYLTSVMVLRGGDCPPPMALACSPPCPPPKCYNHLLVTGEDDVVMCRMFRLSYNCCHMRTVCGITFSQEIWPQACKFLKFPSQYKTQSQKYTRPIECISDVTLWPGKFATWPGQCMYQLYHDP